MTDPVYLYRLPERGEPELVDVDPTGRVLPHFAEILGRDVELVPSMQWPDAAMMLAVADNGLADPDLRVNYRAWAYYGGSPIIGPALIFHAATTGAAWPPIPPKVAAAIVAPIPPHLAASMDQAKRSPVNAGYRGRW